LLSITSGSQIRISNLHFYENILSEIILMDIYDTFSPIQIFDSVIEQNFILNSTKLENEKLKCVDWCFISFLDEIDHSPTFHTSLFKLI